MSFALERGPGFCVQWAPHHTWMSQVRHRQNVSYILSICCDKILFNVGIVRQNIDSLVQDYSNSIANALELLQSCTKPSIYEAGT